MYSLVLMAALTTGGNAPECCFFRCDPFPGYYSWCYPPAPYWGYPWYNHYVSYYPYPDFYPNGYGYPCAPAVVIQEQGGTKQEKQKKEEEKKEERKEAKEARLVVELPAHAKLFVDGTLMKSDSSKRGIVTPPLDPARVYYYQVRAELVRDGQTLSETQRI